MMRWVLTPGTPASLRLRAADYLRLAREARNSAVSRQLEELAIRYLTLAQQIEEHGAPGLTERRRPADTKLDPAN